MKRKILGFTLVLIIVIIPIYSAFASFYAWQNLEVKILKQETKPKYIKKFKVYAVRTVVKVTKLGKSGGFLQNYCFSYLNKMKTAVIMFKSLADAKKLKVGKKLKVKYSYVSGTGYDRRTRRPRAIEDKTWKFIKYL